MTREGDDIKHRWDEADEAEHRERWATAGKMARRICASWGMDDGALGEDRTEAEEAEIEAADKLRRP